MGQAAGTAAAQSVVTCEPANKLNARALRESLVQNNAFLENYIGWSHIGCDQFIQDNKGLLKFDDLNLNIAVKAWQHYLDVDL